MVPGINLLPSELLSEILQRVVQGPKAQARQHVRFLSHVDRHWRSVALNTPQLWTTIITGHPFKATSDPEYIAVWVKRAKALPITFVLRGLTFASINAIVEVFKTIGPSVETIYFEGGFCWPPERAFKDVAPGTFSFPRLRRLKFCGDAALLTAEKHFLHAMPILEQVTIDVKAFCHWSMIKAFLPWITHFRVGYTNEHTIAELFLHAPLLQYCALNTHTASLDIPQPFQHATLRSLFVRAWQRRPLGLGEQAPSFPNLKHLGISTRATILGNGTMTVPRLLQPSSAGLQYLELCLPALILDQFSQCLAHMPDLRFLHLYGGVPEGYINTLVYHPVSSPVVPKLEVLSISGIEFKPKVLWEFASSRARGLEHGTGSRLVHPFSAPRTLNLPSTLSTEHIQDPPRGALWYIKISEETRINSLRSFFVPVASRLQVTLGVTLKITGGAHHHPHKDAMDLLGLDLSGDSDLDWRGTV